MQRFGRVIPPDFGGLCCRKWKWSVSLMNIELAIRYPFSICKYLSERNTNQLSAIVLYPWSSLRFLRSERLKKPVLKLWPVWPKSHAMCRFSEFVTQNAKKSKRGSKSLFFVISASHVIGLFMRILSLSEWFGIWRKVFWQKKSNENCEQNLRYLEEKYDFKYQNTPVPWFRVLKRAFFVS